MRSLKEPAQHPFAAALEYFAKYKNSIFVEYNGRNHQSRGKTVVGLEDRSSPDAFGPSSYQYRLAIAYAGGAEEILEYAGVVPYGEIAPDDVRAVGLKIADPPGDGCMPEAIHIGESSGLMHGIDWCDGSYPYDQPAKPFHDIIILRSTEARQRNAPYYEERCRQERLENRRRNDAFLRETEQRGLERKAFSEGIQAMLAQGGLQATAVNGRGTTVSGLTLKLSDGGSLRITAMRDAPDSELELTLIARDGTTKVL